jgi:putative transcriptional regulator
MKILPYTINVKSFLHFRGRLISMDNRIKELRKFKKLSQEDLAKACEVSRQTINAIENNKYDPSLALAFQLAENLEVSVDELFLYQNGRNLQ